MRAISVHVGKEKETNVQSANKQMHKAQENSQRAASKRRVPQPERALQSQRHSRLVNSKFYLSVCFHACPYTYTSTFTHTHIFTKTPVVLVAHTYTPAHTHAFAKMDIHVHNAQEQQQEDDEASFM